MTALFDPAMLKPEAAEFCDYRLNQIKELSSIAQTERAAWDTLSTCLCLIDATRNANTRQMWREVYNRVLDRFDLPPELVNQAFFD